jgi:hypothetical protein
MEFPEDGTKAIDRNAGRKGCVRENWTEKCSAWEKREKTATKSGFFVRHLGGKGRGNAFEKMGRVRNYGKDRKMVGNLVGRSLERGEL